MEEQNEQCDYAYLCAELEVWPTKQRMASLLKNAGLNIYVGRYSIRIEDFSHFTFEEYGGDMGDPVVDADCDTLKQMLHESSIVSNILCDAGIRHRFEIYGADRDVLRGYFHHNWPCDESLYFMDDAT